MIHQFIGSLHLGAALASLALGVFVLLRPKSGVWHRRVGYAYTVSLVGMNITALFLFRLTGAVNFFHIAAVASLLTLIFGLRAAIIRRTVGGWIDTHYRLMAWSYVGLVAALVAETSTRLLAPWLATQGAFPMGKFWMFVCFVSVVVFLAGGICIESVGRRTAARVQKIYETH